MMCFFGDYLICYQLGNQIYWHELYCCSDQNPFVKVCLSFPGSLEMDSPSQPVNNHHVHSHATVESKPHSWNICLNRSLFSLFFYPSPLLANVCVNREEVQHTVPPHY